ncbi:hypothetical protein ABPG74_020336 [Tetrahymena malaccensis]
MRIIKKYISKGEGYLTLVPTEEEDYWHIYNLVSNGDIVRSATFRKITKESKTGVKDVIKKKITLTLKIVAINYYAGEFLQLSLKGRNIKENDYLKMGQYHTFNLELDQQITIIKQNWDSFHFKIIKDISDPTHDSELAAFVMDEGIAHLCFIKSSITIMKHKIEKHIPKKKSGAEQHDKAMEKFFETCFEYLMTMNYDQIKCLVLASPGYVKDDFYKYIQDQMQRADLAAFNKKSNFLQKIVRAKSSTGYLNSLSEVLSDPTIQEQLKDTKAIKEVKALDDFYKVMSKDPDMVCYGQKHVFKAYEDNAIQTLLLSDSLFRIKDLNQRKRFNHLIDDTKKKGIDSLIFSSLHSSGEKLNNLTGIAAILRYPIPYEDEEMEQNEEIVENFRVKIDEREDVEEEKSILGDDEKMEAERIAKELEAFSLENLDEEQKYDEDENL